MVEVVYSQFFSVFAHAEIRINDIPVARAQPDEQKTSNAPIREYLLPGRNSASLHVWQDASQTGWHPHMKLEARVAIFEDGDWLEFDGGARIGLSSSYFCPRIASG